MKKRLGRLGAIFALIIFISYQGSAFYYTHFHSFSGGNIVHFHPYSKQTPHHHTLNELMSIDAILHFIGIVISIFVLHIIATTGSKIKIIKLIRIILPVVIHSRHYRGPPLF